jgi:hypothetical protein
MELCKGFEDWFECLKCPYLCTKTCPIEGENVIEKMKGQIRILSGISEARKADRV